MIDERIRSTVDALSAQIIVPPLDAIERRHRRRAFARAAVAIPLAGAAVAIGLVATGSLRSSADRTPGLGGTAVSNEIAPGVLAEGLDLRHSVPDMSGHFVVLSPNAIVLGGPTRDTCGMDPALLQSPKSDGQAVVFEAAAPPHDGCRRDPSEPAGGQVYLRTVVTAERHFHPSVKTLRVVADGRVTTVLTRLPRSAVDLDQGLAVVTGEVDVRPDEGRPLPAVVQVYQRSDGKWHFQANAKVADNGTFAALVIGSSPGTPVQLRASTEDGPCVSDRILAVGGSTFSAVVRCGTDTSTRQHGAAT